MKQEWLLSELREENFDRPQYAYALQMIDAVKPQRKRFVEFGAGAWDDAGNKRKR